jgi:TrmH family RNA methyltransferase
VSTLAHPPRVIGVFRQPERSRQASPPTLALWRVSDPGNVGTLLRSADAFGAALLLSEGCADPFGPKALRAAMGSTFRVPLVDFQVLPGSVALVADGGEPIHEVDLERHPNFVLGSEREGLPEEIRAQCDLAATIPTRVGVESLNVATAGAVALFAYAQSTQSRRRP